MRYRIREQSYIDAELNRQVRAYAAAKGWTHSAFTREAYKRLLNGDRGDPDLVIRRLDTLGRGFDGLQNTLELVGVTVALYAKLCLRHLQLSASTQDSPQRGDSLYGELMRGVATKFRAGRRLQGEVFPPSGDELPPRPGSGPFVGSGKGSGGR